VRSATPAEIERWDELVAANPDGGHILAQSGTSLWLIGSDGAPALSTTAGNLFAWRADSGAVAFVDDQGVTIATVGGTKQTVPFSGGTIRALIWSPDGTRLAIWGGNQTIVVGLDGKTTLTLAPSPTDQPAWIEAGSIGSENV